MFSEFSCFSFVSPVRSSHRASFRFRGCSFSFPALIPPFPFFSLSLPVVCHSSRQRPSLVLRDIRDDHHVSFDTCCAGLAVWCHAVGNGNMAAEHGQAQCICLCWPSSMEAHWSRPSNWQPPLRSTFAGCHDAIFFPACESWVIAKGFEPPTLRFAGGWFTQRNGLSPDVDSFHAAFPGFPHFCPFPR